MEEWVGRQWHRFITRAADGRASHAPVRLEEMQRTIGLMFRAGGGGQGVRIAPAGTSRVGGARSLLQRIAGGNSNGFTPVQDDPEAHSGSAGPSVPTGTNSIGPRQDISDGDED